MRFVRRWRKQSKNLSDGQNFAHNFQENSLCSEKYSKNTQITEQFIFLFSISHTATTKTTTVTEETEDFSLKLTLSQKSNSIFFR